MNDLPKDREGIARPGLAARLDALPVTRLHWAIMLTCALGLLFDVVEAGLSNALSAVFSAAPYQVMPGQLSLLLASVFIGGALGAPLLGMFADRHGRRVALGTSLMVLTATSLMAAASTDIGWLIFFRVLSGIALGAYPPLATAYLSDVLPPQQRGRLMLITAAIGFLGAPAIVFLMRWLTPLQPLGFEGWRWALAIGAIGSAAVAVAFRALPESPRWLIATGQDAAAHAVYRLFERSARRRVDSAEPPDAAISRPETAAPDRATGRSSAPGGRLPRHAVLFGVLDFLGPWATIGFPLLSGAVLVQKGFRVSDSLLFVGISMFGPTVGVLAGSLIIDHVERRTALIVSAIAMAVLGLVFAASEAPPALIAAGVAFNLIGAVYVVVLNVYAAEVFPTEIRATVSAATWAANRVAAVFVPIALLPLLKGAGAIAMFAVIAAALLASVALIALAGPVGVARRPVR